MGRRPGGSPFSAGDLIPRRGDFTIDILELWAICLILLHWSNQLRRILIGVQSDGAMAVVYSNH